MLLSVIIPTLDEEKNLEATLDSLLRCSADENGEMEIIIADGESRDSTIAIAEKFSGVTVLTNLEPGRAKQLNSAAKTARGELLLFLHADTIVTKEAMSNLLRTMKDNPDLIGGGFYRYFDSRSLLLKTTCWMAGLRSRFWHIFLGDQAIFVRKPVFEQLSRFNENLPYGEDLDFSIRMRKAGKTTVIGPAVLSSARRFDKNGPARQTWIDCKLAIGLCCSS